MEICNSNKTLSDRQKWDLSEFSLGQCEEAIELLQRRMKQLTNADYQSYMEKQVKDLELSKRVSNALATNGIHTIGDIMNYGLEKLNLLRGCGAKAHFEIKEVVLKDMPAKNHK